MKQVTLLILCLSAFSKDFLAQTLYKCPSEAIIINGNIYSEPGTYSIKYIGSSGQDSIVQLTIVDYQEYHDHFLRTICIGGIYDGVYYKSDTMLVDSFLTINGCDSIMTTVIDVQEFVGADIIGDFHLCDGDTVLLTTGFYPSYLWSTGATTKAINVSTPGEYSVIITSPIGCTDTLVAAVTMSDFDIEVEISDVACKDELTGEILITKMESQHGIRGVNLNNIAADVDNGRFFSGLRAGDYALHIYDNEGCSYNDSIEITQPEALWQLELISDKEVIKLDDEITCSVRSNIPVDQIRWYADEVNLGDRDHLSLVISKPTSIEAEVTDENGCVKSIHKELIPLKPIGLTVPNIFSPNGDGVNDVFYLQGDEYLDYIQEVSIADRYGNIVFQYKGFDQIDSFDWDGRMNGRAVNKGNYLIFIVYSYRGERRTYKNIITII